VGRALRTGWPDRQRHRVAALVAVACAAINIALTLAVEVIIFAARAWHRVPSPE
jgi:hypothetical protein